MTPEPGAPVAPITLMTWNVRYFGHALRGLLTTERGVDRAAHVLSTLVPLPDLIALQEVETSSIRSGLRKVPQIERFMKRFHAHLERAGREERYEALYYPAHAYQLGSLTPFYTQGLAILVGPRFDVEVHNAEDPHDITHVKTPAFQRVKQRRIVGHARVVDRSSGETLDLFNTHMSLPSFFEVGPTRVPRRMGHGSNQIEEVAALMDFVQQRAGDAAVIVGDFNTLPGSPAYRRILDAGFHDAFAAANELELADLHGHATAGFGRSRMHIDHVFSTEAVRWDAVDAFHFGDPHHFHGLSDHTPKIGRLWLPSQEA